MYGEYDYAKAQAEFEVRDAAQAEIISLKKRIAAAKADAKSDAARCVEAEGEIISCRIAIKKTKSDLKRRVKAEYKGRDPLPELEERFARLLREEDAERTDAKQ